MAHARLTGTKSEAALQAIPAANAARFWTNVQRLGDDDCWPWQAARRATGYGVWRVAGAVVQAHQVAYTLTVGQIPSGHELHHRCHNPPCVNPGHLEPVTVDQHRLRRKIRPQRRSSIHRYETKSGTRWKVAFRVGGYQYFRSFDSLAEAEKLQALIAEIGTLKVLQQLTAKEADDRGAYPEGDGEIRRALAGHVSRQQQARH